MSKCEDSARLQLVLFNEKPDFKVVFYCSNTGDASRI